MTNREALDDWMERSGEVLDAYEAHKRATSTVLGHEAVDSALADEERVRDALQGSEEEVDVLLWQRTHPQQHSPNFYV